MPGRLSLVRENLLIAVSCYVGASYRHAAVQLAASRKGGLKIR